MCLAARWAEVEEKISSPWTSRFRVLAVTRFQCFLKKVHAWFFKCQSVLKRFTTETRKAVIREWTCWMKAHDCLSDVPFLQEDQRVTMNLAKNCFANFCLKNGALHLTSSGQRTFVLPSERFCWFGSDMEVMHSSTRIFCTRSSELQAKHSCQKECFLRPWVLSKEFRTTKWIEKNKHIYLFLSFGEGLVFHLVSFLQIGIFIILFLFSFACTSFLLPLHGFLCHERICKRFFGSRIIIFKCIWPIKQFFVTSRNLSIEMWQIQIVAPYIKLKKRDSQQNTNYNNDNKTYRHSAINFRRSRSWKRLSFAIQLNSSRKIFLRKLKYRKKNSTKCTHHHSNGKTFMSARCSTADLQSVFAASSK